MKGLNKLLLALTARILFLVCSGKSPSVADA